MSSYDSAPAMGFDKTLQDWSRQPFLEWAGIRVTERIDGRARMVLPIRVEHRGGGGSDAANGAIIAYMLDALLGAACSTIWSEDRIPPVTVSLTINYLNPIYGSEASGVAQVVHSGRSLCFTAGHIYDENNVKCVESIATYKRVMKQNG